MTEWPARHPTDLISTTMAAPYQLPCVFPPVPSDLQQMNSRWSARYGLEVLAYPQL